MPFNVEKDHKEKSAVRVRLGAVVCAFALAVWIPKAHAFDLALSVSPPFTQLVGDRSTLTAVATDTGGAEILYQFATRPDNGSWRVVRNFDTTTTIEWATLDEGFHSLRVVGLNRDTGELQIATTNHLIESRIIDGNAVVSQMSNPLVALYSAPPCTTGGSLRVRFRPASGGDWTDTPTKPCGTNESVNFYLAGMTADTQHIATHVGSDGGNPIFGDPVFFATGSFTLSFADQLATPIPPNAQTSEEDVVLLSYVGTDRHEVATDLSGNPIWYYADDADGTVDSSLYRPVAGGTLLAVLNDDLASSQRFVELDLAGNVLRETSETAINRELAAIGEDPNNSFHHDAIRLPNGHTAVLGRVERILTDVQGPGDIDVLGDSIYVLDEDFQLVWAWNPFDHLDPSEVAILGETCFPGQGGCPDELHLAEIANDWTHANGLDYSPEDGNLIMSVRHLDAAFKVDYADGAGTGDVVWRLGRGGDFTLVDPSADTFPWFSHQHYTHYENGLFVVYDNGNTRVSEEGSGVSRGQIFILDETNLIAVLARNHGFGDYAPAVGSAEILANGNMSADTSFLDSNNYPFLPPDEAATIVTETLPDGQLNYVFATTGRVYRAWRMNSLYEPAS